ncbi:MAG TPA: hypothetical protein VKA06_09465, partial [Spirochaetia bacterium]|nr:hypothetical protein [Spirochaetia bacterium]
FGDPAGGGGRHADARGVRGVPAGPSRVTIIPGLTSTEKDRIPAFVRDLRASEVREIALFPTVLDKGERVELYGELASISGLTLPHVHLRTDCDEDEMQMLVERFDTRFFNIHPEKSTHPFGVVPPRFTSMVFVENVQIVPEDGELAALGGICPDYSHLESARRLGWSEYVETVERQLGAYRIGCCHVSAIRDGDPNPWNGGPDHHNFRQLSDLDYLKRYARVLPEAWVSLELENSLAEQLEASEYLEALLDLEGEHMDERVAPGLERDEPNR